MSIKNTLIASFYYKKKPHFSMRDVDTWLSSVYFQVMMNLQWRFKNVPFQTNQSIKILLILFIC